MNSETKHRVTQKTEDCGTLNCSGARCTLSPPVGVSFHDESGSGNWFNTKIRRVGCEHVVRGYGYCTAGSAVTAEKALAHFRNGGTTFGALRLPRCLHGEGNLVPNMNHEK